MSVAYFDQVESPTKLDEKEKQLSATELEMNALNR